MWELQIDKNTGHRVIFNRLNGDIIATLSSKATDEDGHKMAAAPRLLMACSHAQDKFGSNEVIEHSIAHAKGQHLLVSMLEP